MIFKEKWAKKNAVFRMEEMMFFRQNVSEMLLAQHF